MREDIPLDAPIPGMSLTHELGARPWQTPPKAATVAEAMETYLPAFQNEDVVPEQFKKEVIRTSVMKQEIKSWPKETGEIPDGIEIESREYVVLNK